MSLKALANKILQRDKLGINNGTASHNPSQKRDVAGKSLGTVILFPLTQDAIDDYQERSAIMEYGGGFSQQKAETLAFL